MVLVRPYTCIVVHTPASRNNQLMLCYWFFYCCCSIDTPFEWKKEIWASLHHTTPLVLLVLFCLSWNVIGLFRSLCFVSDKKQSTVPFLFSIFPSGGTWKCCNVFAASSGFMRRVHSAFRSPWCLEIGMYRATFITNLITTKELASLHQYYAILQYWFLIFSLKSMNFPEKQLALDH